MLHWHPPRQLLHGSMKKYTHEISGDFAALEPSSLHEIPCQINFLIFSDISLPETRTFLTPAVTATSILTYVAAV